MVVDRCGLAFGVGQLVKTTARVLVAPGVKADGNDPVLVELANAAWS